ncbi:hypothetical protein HDE_10468 [Halotydeus destructor]|nr:hypothetical protein HDE_10468 [Halotydeus destructor]
MVKLTVVILLALGFTVSQSLRVKRSRITARNPYNGTVDCHDRDVIDQASLRMLFYGDRKSWLPLSADDMVNRFCVRTKEAEAQVRAYAKKCLKPFAKQVIGMIVYAAGRQMKKYCDNEVNQATIIRHSQCSKDKDFEPVHKCLDTFVLKLESIRDSIQNLDLKLPYTCCQFHQYKECIVRETRNLGCGSESIEFAKSFIDEVSSDALDLTCINYEEGNANCDKLAPLALNAVRFSVSIVPPLVDIYTAL